MECILATSNYPARYSPAVAVHVVLGSASNEISADQSALRELAGIYHNL
jgi:hypothetical protein